MLSNQTESLYFGGATYSDFHIEQLTRKEEMFPQELQEKKKCFPKTYKKRNRLPEH
jgi:hypothetical protein